MPESYEQLGSFYLGREVDPDGGTPVDRVLLYDSKDIVTHGVVLGMTGSGKTGLCMALLEEAAMDHVPAIVIDPKGDIANLMLTFPDLAPCDFRPWINEDDAARKGMTPEAFAEKTAAMWKQGLQDWGQPPGRIAAFRERADVNIFTPGSNAGIPVSILSSLGVPPVEIVDDAELFGERIESTVSSLLSLVGVDDDPIQSPAAILLANLFAHEWGGGRDLSLESLIRLVQRPPFDKVGVIEVDAFLPAKDRLSLALRFNHLVASPGFAAWLEGEPLDIAGLLHTPQGKPRISIFSIAHLSDSERMFFVSLLLNQLLGWMRGQKGTTSLRALLYMDEIYGYLPPTANPPSKKPMMTLLKQARAFGLGCLFATQNPVDLDYKALSNIGSWFLGRLQTERDKLRVLDGLEGAAASQDAGFDRAAMEKLLSGLGSRVFLLNNVHAGAPVLFHVRWVMSYLAGPLTREAIKRLMDSKRAARVVAAADGPATRNPMAMPPAAVVPSSPRPAVGPGVIERFVPVAGSSEGAVYRPHLLRSATVGFELKKAGIEGVRRVILVNPVAADGIDWERVIEMPERVFAAEPSAGAGFAELPGYAMNAGNYQQVAKDFSDWLYQHQRAEVFECPELGAYGAIGESEAAFRVRLAHAAREARDAAVEKLRDKIEAKVDSLDDRMATAQRALEREKAQAASAKLDAGVIVLGTLFGAILGGRRRSATTAVRSSSRAYQQQRDVAAAGQKVEDIARNIAELRQELEADVAAIHRQYDPMSLKIETEVLKPARSRIDVEEVALLWLPFDASGGMAW